MSVEGVCVVKQPNVRTLPDHLDAHVKPDLSPTILMLKTAKVLDPQILHNYQ